jgi:Tol biopolymer transport system component
VESNPSFSHDGSWIIFTSQRGGSADLYRVRVDGSGLERLTADPAFDDQGVLSPDGKSLAFVSTRAGRANIWLLELSGGKLTNLTPNSTGDFRPAWSADGRGSPSHPTGTRAIR